MITPESERARYNATAEEVAKAEALFDETPPRHHKAAVSPFHLWLDPVQRYFINAVRG